MPADATLDPKLLAVLKRLVRAKGSEGITETHLIQASADDAAQVARHMAALIAEKSIIKAGITLFAPGFEPK